MVVDLNLIIKTLNNDGIIAIQTDTIYGIIGNPNSEIAINKLYEIKNRKKNKKLSIFVKNKEEIYKICIVSEEIKKFIENELENNTIILEKKDKNYLSLITNNEENIGIRVPNDKILLSILNIFDSPLFATSVNISGEKEFLTYEEIYKNFNGKIDLIINNLDCVNSNIPSKIFKVVNNVLKRER